MRTLQERLTTENTVEGHLKKRAKARRGLCIKLGPVGYAGIPDRLLLLPGGIVVFVELKRPVGGAFEPLQKRWHQKLIDLGFRVWVCHTKDAIDQHLKDLQ